MANLKKGDRVKVDFTNNPETIHAGIRFTGYGVVDRVEDGRVFGRLDDGQTFMCLEGDVEVRQHKYDWSVIPDHVAYMATDADGVACGWLVEPKIMGDAWRNQSHLSAFFYIQSRENYKKHFRGDWKFSLEKRPEEQSQ
ncbi:hypothetical protein [Acinetobacter sp.]|uniref:hypothetical protein n=1 Tax=Acinetobacter sp. TaxID=472 RepID=UPI000C56D01E|nr:hypothetical protein [Acinetobacter sp.]MBC68408.1 hypothetical protein [Acinetobacter sp.]|tara:strand:- start:57 stop:473 length:417 start_codon:yes stop_codon:yes gene_type:complete